MKIKVKKIYLLIHIQAYTRLFDRECGHFFLCCEEFQNERKKEWKTINER